MRRVLQVVVAFAASAALAGDVPIYDDDFESGLCAWSFQVGGETVVFASVNDGSGADGVNCGLDSSAPCLSIGAALTSAVDNLRCEVDVAGGSYFEDVALRAGVDLRGGFDPVTWVQDAASHPATIHGTAGSGDRKAVSYTAGPTGDDSLFEKFVVIAAGATTSSGSSYAVYLDLRGSTGLFEIASNEIHAGNGANGSAGGTGTTGTDGVDGAGRDGDPSGYDAFVTSGTGACDATNDRDYANGGEHTCFIDDLSGVAGDLLGIVDEVNGGDGGGNQCSPIADSETSASDGASGQAGDGGGSAGNPGDAGDDGAVVSLSCSPPTASASGAVGEPGGPGDDGGAGAGCTTPGGTVAAGIWFGFSGSAGADGTSGGGGGGGGAGGGAFCDGCSGGKDSLGGHGGGGGSGGCGGTGGGGGGSGGASFGVFVVGDVSSTQPVVFDNSIVRGQSGNGGAGGQGAPGGSGGSGGGGGTTAVFCTGGAGNGGDGGDGGDGAGGGGGCGGVSAGIYTSGIGTPDYCSANAVGGGSAGTGGDGGLSLGNSGSPGTAGNLVDCSTN